MTINRLHELYSSFSTYHVVFSPARLWWTALMESSSLHWNGNQETCKGTCWAKVVTTFKKKQTDDNGKKKKVNYLGSLQGPVQNSIEESTQRNTSTTPGYWRHLWMGPYPQVFAAAAPSTEQTPENKYGGQRAVRGEPSVGKHPAWIYVLENVHPLRNVFFFSNKWGDEMRAKRSGLRTDHRSMISSVISVTFCRACKDYEG